MATSEQVVGAASTGAASSAATTSAHEQPGASEGVPRPVNGGSTEPAAAPAARDGEAATPVEEDEEEETCGFCIFMKAGGCKEAFNAWSKCVDKERQSGGDFTEECREKTFALRDCMLQNKEYYAPVLEEEEGFVDEKEQSAEAEKQALESDEQPREDAAAAAAEPGA